jgi:hypothetical protein
VDAQRIVRVPQPRYRQVIKGTPQARQTGVAFFLVTFYWRRKKK